MSNEPREKIKNGLGHGAEGKGQKVILRQAQGKGKEQRAKGKGHGAGEARSQKSEVRRPKTEVRSPGSANCIRRKRLT